MEEINSLNSKLSPLRQKDKSHHATQQEEG